MNINKKYYATFGQQSLFKNFYIEIISPSYEMSLDAVLDFKRNISMIYTETEFCAHVKAMFPNGKLCTLRYLESIDRFVAEKGDRL